MPEVVVVVEITVGTVVLDVLLVVEDVVLEVVDDGSIKVNAAELSVPPISYIVSPATSVRYIWKVELLPKGMA